MSGGSAHKAILEKLELRLKVLKAKEERMEGWEMFSWSREEEKRALMRELEEEKRQWEKKEEATEGEAEADDAAEKSPSPPKSLLNMVGKAL